MYKPNANTQNYPFYRTYGHTYGPTLNLENFCFIVKENWKAVNKIFRHGQSDILLLLYKNTNRSAPSLQGLRPMEYWEVPFL